MALTTLLLVFDPRQLSPTAIAALGTFAGSIVGWFVAGSPVLLLIGGVVGGVLAGRALGQYDEPLRVGTMGGMSGVAGFVALFGVTNGSSYQGFIFGVAKGLGLAGPLLFSTIVGTWIGKRYVGNGDGE